MSGKWSSCPIKQKLQPRNSCPGRNPWPCFQYSVYHATFVRHQSLPRHQTQHSRCSASLKSHLFTPPLLNTFISSSSNPHTLQLGWLIIAAHRCIVWKCSPWVNKDEGDHCCSERAHCGNSAERIQTQTKELSKLIPTCTVILFLSVSLDLYVHWLFHAACDHTGCSARPANSNHTTAFCIFHLSVQLGNIV